MKIKWDCLRRRENLNFSGVCLTSMTICRSRNLIGIDDWENGSLRESIIASIEEENAIDLKFGSKNCDKAVPFSYFSTETGQDTMKEVQGASTVENTSLKSAKTILSKVVDECADNQDHTFSHDAIEAISEKTSLKCEQPAYCIQRQSREGLLLSITLREREVESQKLMTRTKKCVLHRAN